MPAFHESGSIDPIVVGGLTRFSSVDYPGHLAAVVFCQGCPWRCGYCHNAHLQTRRAAAYLAWDEITDWLDNRHGLLDAVVFSGGEPLLQRGLAQAARQVEELGYGVALHTIGVYPERLADLLPRIDWVGFDVKAPFEDYPRITGAGKGCGAAARRSLALLLASGTAHEVRCTADETRLSPEDAQRMAAQLSRMGVRRLTLQTMRDAKGRGRPVSPRFIDAVRHDIEEVAVR